MDVFRPHNARVTTAKRLPCVRVDGTWFNTGGANGSAMTVGGLDMCGCSESNMTSLAGFGSTGNSNSASSPPPESLRNTVSPPQCGCHRSCGYQIAVMVFLA